MCSSLTSSLDTSRLVSRAPRIAEQYTYNWTADYHGHVVVYLVWPET